MTIHSLHRAIAAPGTSVVHVSTSACEAEKCLKISFSPVRWTGICPDLAAMSSLSSNGALTSSRKLQSFRPARMTTVSAIRTGASVSSDDTAQPMIDETLRSGTSGQGVISSAEAAATFAWGMTTSVSSDKESSQAEKEEIMERAKRRKFERRTYMIAAIASTTGITVTAAAAVWYRFAYQMQSGAEIPYAEMFGTFALTVGAAVGMEFWARWAHKALWHDSLWSMHESHHRAREGPFEMNDIFAIINAVPAIALIAYGFFNSGIVPGACFGAGLGITVFGMAYMFVHDGMVHKRFPVGPVADVPYLQKVAAAHQLHHADKFDGVPYGLFLGPYEIERVGGKADLEAILDSRKKTPVKEEVH